MSDRPTRIQRRRTPGWRKPPGAVTVTRGTRWGNPYPVDRTAPDLVAEHRRVVRLFAADLATGRLPFTIADARRDLAGRDLCCWCAPDLPCHADLLLAVAAGADPREVTR